MKKVLALILVISSLFVTACSDDTSVSKRDDDDDESTSISSKNKNNNSGSDVDDENYSDVNDGNFPDEKPGRPNNEGGNQQVTESLGKDNNPSDDDADYVVEDGEYVLSSPRTLTVPEIGSFVIKSYSVYNQYGNTYITMKGDYTNLVSDYDECLGEFLTYMDVYQNGVLLSYTITGHEIDTYTYVKPNKTITASLSYQLRNIDEDIEIIGTDYNDNEYVITFPLADDIEVTDSDNSNSYTLKIG